MKNKGFTLIELVVVIVILAILAVTAAPRFLNLQEDARKSALQGLKGAMDGAAGITYGKAAVENQERASAAVMVGEVETKYGFPTATSAGIVTAVTGLDTNSWSGYSDKTSNNNEYDVYVATFYSSTIEDASDVTDTDCYVRYSQATGVEVNQVAKAEVFDDGC
ncbi:type II secretion system protein [Vibrio agarivorans]|uniref:Type II secretion system protein n=1 Tax=Vibrio agarivorans TaxID=153622 RepID=A0ABT7XWI8_9VIBR|nr:type II secretion system protein [Vibrio agarivorans]MDN2480149.1 type II secretion system protein [Vibrio agarivorans]